MTMLLFLMMVLLEVKSGTDQKWNLPRTGYNFFNNLFFFHATHLHLQILILSVLM